MTLLLQRQENQTLPSASHHTTPVSIQSVRCRQAIMNALARRHASNRTIQLAGWLAAAALRVYSKHGKPAKNHPTQCAHTIRERGRPTGDVSQRAETGATPRRVASGAQCNSSGRQSIAVRADARRRSLEQSHVCLSVCLSVGLCAYEYIHINVTAKMPWSQRVLDPQLFRLQPELLCTGLQRTVAPRTQSVGSKKCIRRSRLQLHDTQLHCSVSSHFTFVTLTAASLSASAAINIFASSLSYTPLSSLRWITGVHCE